MVGEYWAAVLPVIARLADDAGIDTTTQAYLSQIAAALASTGLGPFQDFLPNGITTLAVPPSGVFNTNGVYRLSDAADTLTLSGETQAVYGLGGDDHLIATNISRNATVLLDGGRGNDMLQGTERADWLDGGAGADHMEGLGGNDTYVVDNVGDTVLEGHNEGIDTVRSSIDYQLGATVEHLVLLGTAALRGRGNAGDNQLTGNSGANVLTGGAGADTLDGGAGADTLIGGTGKDLLMGGLGADIFDFNTLEDSVRGVDRDVIRDLNPAESDKVDVSSIDANVHVLGNQAFDFIESRLCSRTSGELRCAGNTSNAMRSALHGSSSNPKADGSTRK